MKQLFSIVLFLFMFAGISAVTLASDVIEKQSYETVDLKFEQSSFDFVVLEVVKKPPIFICMVEKDSYKNYINTETTKNWVVDVGKIDSNEIYTTNTNLIKSQYLDASPIEIINAKSRLMCSYINA